MGKRSIVGNMAATCLSELSLVYDIQSLAEAYRIRNKRSAINVSHWDPSAYLAAALNRRVPLIDLGDPMPYLYSYMLEQMPELLSKLGFAAETVAGLATENGTNSIVAVANWLALIEVREVFVLGPHYFTVLHNLRRLGIQVREIKMARADGIFALPADLSLHQRQALWVTNPVCNTGIYWLERFGKELLEFAESGAIVIADETLALPPSRTAGTLGGHQNFVGIYSPHKSICVNRLKFSVVVFHPRHKESFKCWADVLAGGLSLSARAAIEHFLSPAFEEYRGAFLNLIDTTKLWHECLLLTSQGGVESDKELQHGHFLTIYVPHIDCCLERDLSFLERLLDETGCVLIPGTYSYADSTRGFSFRVNLAQDSPEFRAALPRLYRFLNVQ